MLLLPRYKGVKHICGALPTNVAAARISMNAFLQSQLRPPTDSQQAPNSTETNQSVARTTKSSVAIPMQELQQLAEPLKDELQHRLALFKNAGRWRKNFPAEKGKEKFNKRLFKYIEQLSYLDEVQKAQDEVMLIKEELRRTGVEKRKIMRELKNVRNDLTRIFAMKSSSNRSSENYLDLVKNEFELCQKEQQLQDAFTQADDKEQYLFNSFDSAINVSIQKEKVHTNFVKLLGVFSSIVAAVVAIMGYVYNQNRHYTSKQNLEDTISRNVVPKLDEILRSHRNTATPPKPNQESWGSYLKRHTRWLYGWAMPRN